MYPRIIHNLLFLDNYYRDSIIAVGWSLAVEVHVYILLPFVILFIHRVKSYSGVILWLLLLISLAIRYFVCLTHPEIFEMRWVDILNNRDAVFIAMGTIYNPGHARFGLLILGMIWAHSSIMNISFGDITLVSLLASILTLLFAMALHRFIEAPFIRKGELIFKS